MRFEAQSEASECALACLAMVASRWQPDVSLRGLRAQLGSSARGADLKTLMAWAAQLGLIARPLRLSLHELPQLHTPCILHWDLNHFVVLERCRGRRLQLADPATGRRRLSLAECGEHFTGIALELTPSESMQVPPPAPTVALRQLTGPLTRFSTTLALVTVLSVLLQVIGLAGPLYLQTVIDEVLPRQDHDLLTVLGLGFGLLLLLEVLIQSLRGTVLVQLAARLSLALGQRAIGSILQARPGYFSRRAMGDLLSRFQSLDPVRDLLTEGVIASLVDGLLALGTLAMLFLYSPRLATLAVATTIAVLLTRLLFFPVLRDRTAETLIANARADSHFMETLRAFVTVKLLQREDHRQSQWLQHRARAVEREQSQGLWQLGEQASTRLLLGTEHLLLIYLGAQLVLDGGLSVGMLFAFVSYKARFSQAVGGLTEQVLKFRMLSLHRERLAELVLAPRETVAAPRQSRLANGPAGLRAEGLWFRHGDGEPWLLRDLHWQIEPGECVGIAGPSGCGKSTLLHLLTGLADPQRGQVLYEERAIDRHPGYRGEMGAVLQTDQLLSGSIFDNICAFDPVPDVERVSHCAQLAAIHNDILALPMQYQTLVGELGASLSGGQQQRLLLARALYRRPRILFLDEATSHLDPAGEATVLANLKRQAMTRVLIAHRPQTLAACDRVVTLASLNRA